MNEWMNERQFLSFQVTLQNFARKFPVISSRPKAEDGKTLGSCPPAGLEVSHEGALSHQPPPVAVGRPPTLDKPVFSRSLLLPV